MSEPPAKLPASAGAEPPAPEISALQRWMQAVITHPAGIEAGIADAAAQAEIPVAAEGIEQVIVRSRNLTSVERLAVYGNAYYARLIECLRSIFPALVATLEEDVFDEFAFDYLQQYPSQSYTLDRLADHFVEFLEATRPKTEEETESLSRAQSEPPRELSWPDFLIDLARFEMAVGEVFDGPGSEELPQLSPASLAGVPPSEWAAARLVASPSLRLLAFRFPLNDYYTAVRRAETPALPAAAPEYLALWRRQYIVRRLPLSAEQHALLAAILAGQSVGDSLAAAAELAIDFEAFAAALPSWFHEWAAAGFFVRIELAAAPAASA